MTTIGTAVLQIIPSLKGVTDAIEKQIDGKVVEVKIAPKVDKTATTKAGKEAGEAIVKEAKDAVSKGDIGKAVSDEIKTSVKKAAPGKDVAKLVTDDVKKASPGQEIGKVILDGLAEGVRQALPSGSVGAVILDGISDGVQQGIDEKGSGLGGKIAAGVIGGLKDGLQNTKLTDALGGLLDVNITGPAQSITNALTPLHEAIAGFKEGDVAGGLQAATTALRGLEGIGIPPEIADSVGRIGDVANQSKGQASELLTPLQQVTELAGPDSKIFKAGSKLPIVGAFVDALPIFAQMNTEAEGLVKNLTGMNIPLSPKSLIAKLLDDGPNGLGVLTTATDRAHQALQAAQEQEQALRINRGDRDPSLPPNVTGGRATGGMVTGPGTGLSDSILARLSNGEFVINADATRKNLPLLEIINSGKLPGFAGGGLVKGDQDLADIIKQRFGVSDIGGYRPADKYGEHSTGRALDVMVGGDKAKGDAIKDFALANASAIDLKWAIWRQHLYYPGGGGYDMPDRGSPTQNHMDHVHIFSGAGITNGLRGALQGVGKSVLPSLGGPGAEDTSSRDQTAPATSAGNISLASSFSGLAGSGLSGLGKGIGTTGSGTDLSVFGNAAASAVSGQVSSALGVFGIDDAPPFLQAASQLLGGIKIGGGSALSALPGGNMHGGHAGQRPGPTYNIYARDTEDALNRFSRKQDEVAARKLNNL